MTGEVILLKISKQKINKNTALKKLLKKSRQLKQLGLLFFVQRMQ